jgi:hypothetical protein
MLQWDELEGINMKKIPIQPLLESDFFCVRVTHGLDTIQIGKDHNYEFSRDESVRIFLNLGWNFLYILFFSKIKGVLRFMT